MITSGLRQTIENCAKAFDVRTVWLFGSAAQDDSQARDIDLAVEGLPAEKFFDFYARLFFELPKPVDLVDLSQEPPIASIIREKGIRIYERRNLIPAVGSEKCSCNNRSGRKPYRQKET